MAKSFLRIRPIVGCSSKDQGSVFFKLDDTRIECRPPSTSQSFKNDKSNYKELKKKIFEFDRVLDEDTGQEQLYNDCVQPLLTEFFNGENVLLFAYGTTSSGKTHTIRGDAKNPGVVPRCINDIFQSVHNKLLPLPTFKKSKFNEYEQLNKLDFKRDAEIKSAILNSIDESRSSSYLKSLEFRPEGFQSFLKDDENIRHIVWVSFLELYNENLVDLLSINPSDSSINSFVHPHITNTTDRPTQLKLMRDQQQKNFFVSGLTQVYVNSAEEALKVYLFGIENLKKHISSTAMNRTSSRSHSLFTISVITLQAKNQNDYRVIHVNNFSLCDLAGQERGKKTQTTGLHMKEAGMINKSLFTLKRCIQIIKERKLSSSQLIIPFTESVLTKAFQPYLSGSGLTTMIININPKGDHFDETVNSLEFSATATQVVPFRSDSTNSLRDKLRRLTERWLQTSQRWSTMQNFTKDQTSGHISSSKFFSKNDGSSDDREIIKDNLNIVSNFEKSIIQIKEIEESFIEYDYDLFDVHIKEDLNNRYLELEQQIEQHIEDVDRNDTQHDELKLEHIYNSIEEMYKFFEQEKVKIKERMNKLMNERMDMLTDHHNIQANEFEKDKEELNMQLFYKENELERLKADVDERIQQIAQLTSELEETREQLQLEQKSFKLKELEINDQVSELASQLEDARRTLRLKELDYNEKLLINQNYLESKELEFELKADVGILLEFLISEVDFKHRFEQFMQSELGKTNPVPSLNDSMNNKLVDLDQTKRNDEELRNDFSLNQCSLIDFNKSIVDSKRSSLKMPIHFNNRPENSPTLFTTTILPIHSENPTSSRLLDNPLIAEFSSQLNSTTHLSKQNSQMKNADHLLNSIMSKNQDKEIEELKKQQKEIDCENKQLKILLDLKDEEIRKWRADYQRIQKEINKPFKEEGMSMMSSSQAKLTKNLYTSVLNHTSIVGNNTPYKPLSHLASARKKRTYEDSQQQNSDDRYLDFIKCNEKSPTTEKKTKKKRTTDRVVETKFKVKEEPRIEEKIIEEKIDEMDDLMFILEQTEKKKPRTTKIKKEVTTSVRKKIPLEECHESFIENEDDCKLISREDTKKKHNLRSRKKIQY